MCMNLLMVDNSIIQTLLDDLLDKVSLMNCPSLINYPPTLFSSKSIDQLFSGPVQTLNRSIKQVLTHELNTIVLCGAVTNTGITIRNSRYYNPVTSMKQANDLRKRYYWMQRRETLVNYLSENNENHLGFDEYRASTSETLEKLWLDHRLMMLDRSIEQTTNQVVERDENNNGFVDTQSCARCRIYRRKMLHEKLLVKKLQKFQKTQIENLSTNVTLSSESELILSIAKLADQIGHQTNVILSNSSKKNVSTSSSNVKKKSVNASPSLSSMTSSPKSNTASISLMIGETNKNSKRTLDDGKQTTNSQIQNNIADNNQKRQKRIASPLSISSTSIPTTVQINSLSPREILTPTWRLLNTDDLKIPTKTDQINEPQDVEDISDEAYIRRHQRCELTDGLG